MVGEICIDLYHLITIIFEIYIDLKHFVYKPTNIAGGAHLARASVLGSGALHPGGLGRLRRV